MQTTKVSQQTLDAILDFIASSNGVGLTEIANKLDKTVGCVNEACRTLRRQGKISKGVQKKVRSTGELSDKLSPAYYYEGE